MAAAVRFIAVEQESAETEVNSNIWVNNKGISVLNASGNVIWKIAAVQSVEVNPEVFIGTEVILEKHAKSNHAVRRATHETGIYEGAVKRFILLVELIIVIMVVV